VREFLDDLSEEDSAAVAAAMKEVRGQSVIYRLLFAEEGRFGQVLLALEIVNKKWQSAKSRHIQLAERRLREWRQRGSRIARSVGKRPPAK
jgi:phage-related protein